MEPNGIQEVARSIRVSSTSLTPFRFRSRQLRLVVERRVVDQDSFRI